IAVLFAVVSHGDGGQTARAGLIHRLNRKLHVRWVVDLEVKAGVPPSGLAENVEDGFHAATPASSSVSATGGASLASANGSPRMQSAARCAFAAAWTTRRLSTSSLEIQFWI